MSKRILILTAMTCAFVAQAQAHELAYSKAEQVRVMVPGESSDWCKPSLEMTIERPAWESKESLERLLAKIPFILKQECPSATVNWKAVDAKGEVYAKGGGTSQSLGDAQLVAVVIPEAPETPEASNDTQVTPVVATSEPQKATEEKTTAVTPAVEKAEIVAVEPEKVVVPVIAAEDVAKEEVNPSQEAPLVDVEQSKPVIAQVHRRDMGRSVLLESGLYAEVTDNTGCKWLLRNTEVPDGAQNYTLRQEGAACVDGYAVGPVKSLDLMSKSGSGRPAWTRALHVHPSGLILNTRYGPSLDKLPLAIINHDATTAVFDAGKLSDPEMSLYIYFYRNRGDWAMRPFDSGATFVAETVDEQWALDEKATFEVVKNIHQAIKESYSGPLGFTPLVVTTDLKKVFQKERTPDFNHITINGNVSESGVPLPPQKWAIKRNFYAQRVQKAERDARQLAQERAIFHESVLRDYNSMQEEMKSKGLSEHLFAAKKLEIIAELPSAHDMMNPAMATRMLTMLVNVGDREGEYHELSYPADTRLYTERELEEGWYVLPVALLTPSMDLDDGVIINAFRGMPEDGVKSCASEFCADSLSINKIFATRYMRGNPDPLVDWATWTPEISQGLVDKWAEMNSASTTH